MSICLPQMNGLTKWEEGIQKYLRKWLLLIFSAYTLLYLLPSLWKFSFPRWPSLPWSRTPHFISACNKNYLPQVRVSNINLTQDFIDVLERGFHNPLIPILHMLPPQNLSTWLPSVQSRIPECPGLLFQERLCFQQTKECSNTTTQQESYKLWVIFPITQANATHSLDDYTNNVFSIFLTFLDKHLNFFQFRCICLHVWNQNQM